MFVDVVGLDAGVVAQAVLVPESPSLFWQSLRGPQKNTKKQTNWTNQHVRTLEGG